MDSKTKIKLIFIFCLIFIPFIVITVLLSQLKQQIQNDCFPPELSNSKLGIFVCLLLLANVCSIVMLKFIFPFIILNQELLLCFGTNFILFIVNCYYLLSMSRTSLSIQKLNIVLGLSSAQFLTSCVSFYFVLNSMLQLKENSIKPFNQKSETFGNRTETINVLNLCADDNTYQQKKYSNVVHYLYNQYQQQKVNTKYYYLGDNLTIENADDACNVNLLSTNVTFDSHCLYSTNMFNVVVSEGCPAVGSASVFSEQNLDIIKSILKPDGYLILIANRNDTFVYSVNRKEVDIVSYMQQKQNYNFIEKLQMDGKYFYILQNKK